MSAGHIKEALKSAYRAAEGNPPPFDPSWAAAEGRLRSRRRRRSAGLAIAAAVSLFAVVLRTDQPPAYEFMITDALLNDTYWTAPSDVLMPERRFDIYREVHLLDESTISPEGSLL